jgi:crossover junction endodeoxyribonuclease RuvC
MILGIDPGKNGALCFYYNDKKFNLYLMPEMLSINEIEQIFLKEEEPEMVYIEKAHAMPKQGVSSMFNYGMHYGWVLGILQSKGLQIIEVAPQTWCKVIHQGVKQYTGAGSGKKKSLEASRKLFPYETFLATSRSTKPHDGFIDATLIAKYGFDK